MPICSVSPWSWFPAKGLEDIEAPSLCAVSKPVDIDLEDDVAP